MSRGNFEGSGPGDDRDWIERRQVIQIDIRAS